MVLLEIVFCLDQLFACFEFSESFLRFSLHLLLECLCMLLFVYDRFSGVRSLLLRISRVLRIIGKASNTLIIPLYYPDFMHQLQPSNIAWLGSDLNCGFGKQMRQYIFTCLLSNLGSYFYVAYTAMLCSQTWIGFECIHDRCEYC